MPTFQGLYVDAAIVHRVHRRPAMAVRKEFPERDLPPELTDAVVDLDADLRAFFQRRLVRTMQKAFAVRFDETTTSKMPSLLCAVLDDPTELVVQSRDMATELHDAQTALNPEGLVVVLYGRVSERAFVAVLKLEHESGVRSEIVEEPDGRRRFVITIERALVLTDNTRVFKAGLFLAPTAREPDDAASIPPEAVEGWLSDDQVTQGDAPVAQFFRAYLGCTFKRAAEIDTQMFHHAAEVWINLIDDGEKRTRYETALIAELQSERHIISPREFASEFLDVADRAPFIAHLRDENVPTQQFTKNTKLITGRIRRTAVTTEKNVQVIGTVEQFSDGTIRVESGDGDSSTPAIHIEDRIKRVRGA